MVVISALVRGQISSSSVDIWPSTHFPLAMTKHGLGLTKGHTASLSSCLLFIALLNNLIDSITKKYYIFPIFKIKLLPRFSSNLNLGYCSFVLQLGS